MEWKNAWSYIPINHNTTIATIKNTTQRTYFKNNLDGTKVKLKFSNLFSKDALILDNVSIGTRDHKEDVIVGFIPVTYQGSEKIVIPPGEAFYSDEIEINVSLKKDIVISIYVKEQTEIYSVCSTWSARTWHSLYFLNGNHAYEQNFEETDCYDVFSVLQYDINRANHIYGITDIKVYTNEAVKTVALFGDSITHMSYYSDALIEKLSSSNPGGITVLNRGIGGNRLLHDYAHVKDIPGGGTIFGDSGVKRFYNDIYGSDKPDVVIVLIGINDFAHPYMLDHLDEIVSLKEYQIGITELITIAHNNHSKIFIGTITPFMQIEAEWVVLIETLRQNVNEWIRVQKISDGIIDFDLAIRDKKNPEYMLGDCHLGDGIHPNSTGGKKMADTISINLA